MAKLYKVTFKTKANHRSYGWRMDVSAFSAKDAIAKVYNIWHKENGCHMYSLKSAPLKKGEEVLYPEPTQVSSAEQHKDCGR